MRNQLENLTDDKVIKDNNIENNLKTVALEGNVLNSSVHSSNKSNEDDNSISTDEVTK